VPGERWPAADPAAGPPGLPPQAARPRRWAGALSRLSGLSSGIGRRRLLAGVILVAGLPLLTAALVAAQHGLSLADDLLIYLVAVVAVAVVGGFWPAVLAAVTSSLLLNWYFTRPVHTLTIADPQNLLALLLFVTVAVTVSSVVHLSAHRALQAARSSEEAAELLALAQTVLGGADTPAAVLDHLTGTRGGRAELLERVGDQWVRVAASGTAPPDAVTVRVQARPGLALVVSAQSRQVTARLLDGFAAQAAAALDRDRLRTQAAQAEALAEGNRMRTALLAAVSHDLRTPLASIKASVSTLRQTDVQWTAADEAALLATIEQGADRLDALIGNLLDMSRLSTGSLQPFLRPTAIDEVAPVALRGLDGGGTVRLTVPDGLPLVRTDPGLLERVLANLFANALAYSPPARPPSLRASQAGGSVILEITDHGPGVPDGLKARMFEPFERLDASRREASTGTGAWPSSRGSWTPWAARWRPPTPPGAGSPCGWRCRPPPRWRAPCWQPVRDPGPGHRRRGADPAGSADQPGRAPVRGQYRGRRGVRPGGDGPRPARRTDPRPRAAGHGRHRGDPGSPRLDVHAHHRAVRLGPGKPEGGGARRRRG
jgi:two-component system, OmpR family, sensor histidine kinase KdpD